MTARKQFLIMMTQILNRMTLGISGVLGLPTIFRIFRILMTFGTLKPPPSENAPQTFTLKTLLRTLTTVTLLLECSQEIPTALTQSSLVLYWTRPISRPSFDVRSTLLVFCWHSSAVYISFVSPCRWTLTSPSLPG